MFIASLLTRINVVVYRNRRLASRSPGLLRFLAYLWWKRHHYPDNGWVALTELGRVLQRPSPKQMQRYIDALEGAGIALIDYRSKTSGAWRLAVVADKVSIDRADEELIAWLDFHPARMRAQSPLPQMADLAQHLRAALRVDAAFAENGLEKDAVAEAVDTYRLLLETPGATPTMQASLIQRLCMLHRQVSDFPAWRRELAALDALLDSGALDSADFAARSRLQQMFLLYDEGRKEEALHILERIAPAKLQDSFTLGRYWNAMGLATLWRIENSGKVEQLADFHDVLGHYARALGHALAVFDYAGLEGICFNIGNAIYRRVRGSEEDNEAAWREAALWIGLCEMICHRFGVGGAAQWSRLVLVDMAFERGWTLADANTWVGGIYQAYGDFEKLLQNTLSNAVSRNQRLEQAECCRLLVRYHERQGDSARAAWYREEAINIYRDLGRRDKLVAMPPPPPPPSRKPRSAGLRNRP
ncbi:hypothetical protein MASR1M60_20400 [Rhodocyclaceae bacterium]